MPHIFYSLLGAAIMLALGLVDMIILSRLLYPALRERHGRALAHGAKAPSPRLVMRLLWLFNLLALPILGFIAGAAVLPPLFGR